MKIDSDQIRQQVLIERLKLQVNALEQRLHDKEDLVEEVRNQRDKFETQLLKLMEFLEIKYKAIESNNDPRNDFLIRKATEIVANQAKNSEYETDTLETILNEQSPAIPLRTYDPGSIPLDPATNEIAFYTDNKDDVLPKKKKVPKNLKQKPIIDVLTKFDQTNKDKNSAVHSKAADDKSSSSNPFQKTIDRIRISEQKPIEDEGSELTRTEKITEWRSDELDESINKSMNEREAQIQQSDN